MRVLLVEDEKAVRFGVARHLERSGFIVAEAGTCEVARERFRSFDPDAVVTDFRLPDGESLELIASFRRLKPGLSIVVFTGFGSIELAVQALKTGADNLFTKPVDLEKLVEELRQARPAASAPSADRGGAKGEAQTRPGLSRPRADVERLKHIDCSLLIQGETGTGKTMLARSLHEGSRRANKPFIDLNCAGLPRELVESELFGHERGAFTSAHSAKPGLFELADGGTLFLDEIGDIDLAVQPKLLKAIDEKRFRRMGGLREQSVDVRIIAATHRDLREATRTNAFRSDLYYRISAVTITVPALRDRRAEIPALAREVLAALAARAGRTSVELTADAEAALLAYSWPGNVRELKNVLEAALHFAPDGPLSAAQLQLDEEPAPNDVGALSSTLQDLEREHLERALNVHGRVGDAARSLGISRSSMYLKLKAYGLLPGRGSVQRLRVAGGNGS